MTIMRDGSTRYSVPAIVLHWVIALLIIGMIALGYYMINLPKGTPDRGFYFNVVAAVLTALIVLHVLAAFKHLLVDRDRVFQRMIP